MKNLILSALVFPLALGSALITRADEGEAYTFLSGLSQFERLTLSTGMGEGLGTFDWHILDAVVGDHSILFQDGAVVPFRWQLDQARSYCELTLAEGSPLASRETVRFSGDLGLSNVRSDYKSAPAGTAGFWIETRMRIDPGTTRLAREDGHETNLNGAFEGIVCQSPDLLRPSSFAAVTGLSVYAHESMWLDRLISRPQASFAVTGSRALRPAVWRADAVPLRLVGPRASDSP